MNRKPHPSSVLKNLPDEDQAALYEFLRGKSLAEGVQWLFSNNGIRTNDSSLSDWRKWYKLTQRINAWNANAEQLKSLLSTDTTIDPNLVPKLCEAVFMSQAAEDGDPKTFAAMAKIMQRHFALEGSQAAHEDKMKLAAKKLDLQAKDLARKNKELEIKLEQREKERLAAEEAMNRAASEGGMTDDSLKKIRAALGMKVD